MIYLLGMFFEQRNLERSNMDKLLVSVSARYPCYEEHDYLKYTRCIAILHVDFISWQLAGKLSTSANDGHVHQFCSWSAGRLVVVVIQHSLLCASDMHESQDNYSLCLPNQVLLMPAQRKSSLHQQAKMTRQIVYGNIV
jgi:hypothetical protein